MTVVSARLYCLGHLVEVHHAELAPAAIAEVLEALCRRCAYHLRLEDFPLRPDGQRFIDWPALAPLEVEATDDSERELLNRLGCPFVQDLLQWNQDVEVG